MEDSSKWDIPAKIIAEDRAKYYAEHDTKTQFGLLFDAVFKQELENGLTNDYEIHDWAENNMNWSDVKAIAVKVLTKEVDFQEGWLNGEKEVIKK